MVDAHKKFCKSGVIFTNGRVPKIGTLGQQKPGELYNAILGEGDSYHYLPDLDKIL